MALPEQKITEGKSRKSTNILLFFILLVLILGVAFFAYIKSTGIDIKTTSINDLFPKVMNQAKKNIKKDLYTVEYDPKDKDVFTTYQNLLVRCSRTGLKAIDIGGKEKWSYQLSISNPRLKKAGSDLLLYSQGGRDIYVFRGKDLKWNQKVENNIIYADISESGHVSAVEDIKGYKGAIEVFNLQGVAFFVRTMAEKFALLSKVSPTGKFVLINTVDASGVEAVTNIEVTDMFGTPIASKVPKENEFFPNLYPLKNDRVMLVSDHNIVCVDKECNQKWKKEFSNNKIYSSDTAEGNYAFIALSAKQKTGFKGEASEIKIFDADGKETSSYSINDKIINIETYDDIAAVNTGREVYFINTKGKLLGKYTSKTDIIEVHLLNKESAAIVTKTNVIVAAVAL